VAEMRIVADRDTALGRWAIDELLGSYISWREECYAVRLAYERWIASDRGERGLAYAAYVAALDGEEHAARTYAHRVERVKRIAT
jgi:hypothetical protein